VIFVYIDERIREFCLIDGISGIEIGKILGLKKSPLIDWMNGKSKPTLEQFAIICDYYAISSDYLLFGKILEDNLTPDESTLLNIFRQPSYEKQVSIRERALVYLEESLKSTSSESSAEFADKLDVKTKKPA
jgi:transcriptional regulator with XRE-family HTH domain